MKIEHAIFDMDGTLTDSNGIWMDGVFHYINTCCSYTKEDLPEEFFTDIILGGSAAALRYLAKTMGDTNSFSRMTEVQMQGVRKGYETPVEVKKGALEFLKRLKERGSDVCVLSATPLDLVEKALSLCGLLPYVDFIISAHERKTGKEMPYVFYEAAARMNCDVSECTLFEDALYSIKTGKSLGMTCIGISDFYCKPEAKAQIMQLCDFYTDDYSKIVLD